MKRWLEILAAAVLAAVLVVVLLRFVPLRSAAPSSSWPAIVPPRPAGLAADEERRLEQLRAATREALEDLVRPRSSSRPAG